MINLFPILALFTLVGLLYGESHENDPQKSQYKYFFKPTTSLLFLMTALLASQDSHNGTYATLIFIGLICGFLGDVFLMFKTQIWFLAGLVVFLLGHIFYIIAFYDLASPVHLNPLLIFIPIAFSGMIFYFFRPHLGRMQNPVIAYIVVITVMVITALAVYFETDYPADLRQLVAVGAIFFYFSDLSVAIVRFINPAFINRAWGLPMYYAAQFMLAFSIARL